MGSVREQACLGWQLASDNWEVADLQGQHSKLPVLVVSLTVSDIVMHMTAVESCG